MPELIRIKGIIISIYAKDHEPSHVHARRGETNGTFNILTGEMLEGDCSKEDQKIVKTWIEENSKELQTMWETKRFHKF